MADDKRADAASVLHQLADLSDNEVAVFLHALEHGMRDEWDCGLSSFFEIFGEGEFKIAVKTAAGWADYLNHQEDTHAQPSRSRRASHR